ncbi:MAG: citrate/2-methylcitrate synthase, partial [Planctomycetota bacterium]
DPAAWIREQLAAKALVMGFGHRVYKNGDSRTPILRDLCIKAGQKTGETEWAEIGQTLEKIMWDEKKLPANADWYAAPLFRLLGIPADQNTPLFACSRVVGWCAHVIEQHDANRLIRPRSLYTGPERRSPA